MMQARFPCSCLTPKTRTVAAAVLLSLAEAPSDRVVREPAKMPALPVTLVWRATTRRQPALTRLAVLLAAAGARVGAKLKKN